jgi:hypothetical protein
VPVVGRAVVCRSPTTVSLRQREVDPQGLAPAGLPAPQLRPMKPTMNSPRPPSSDASAIRRRGAALLASATSQISVSARMSRRVISPSAYRTALVTSSEAISSTAGARSPSPHRVSCSLDERRASFALRGSSGRTQVRTSSPGSSRRVRASSSRASVVGSFGTRPPTTSSQAVRKGRPHCSASRWASSASPSARPPVRPRLYRASTLPGAGSCRAGACGPVSLPSSDPGAMSSGRGGAPGWTSSGRACAADAASQLPSTASYTTYTQAFDESTASVSRCGDEVT